MKLHKFLPARLRRSILRTIHDIEPAQRMAAYYLLRKKINRNQWMRDNGYYADLWKEYRHYMEADWEETQRIAPAYHARLDFAVSKAYGCVLEIGCGIGTMTRWLANKPEVDHVYALDGFDEAINELTKYQLVNVTPLLGDLGSFSLPLKKPIDVVVICEVIEHLYPDEERRMIENIKRFAHSKTRYIISTPIGYMSDPFHVRGFSKKSFKKHLQRQYGPIDEINLVPNYVQEAVGTLFSNQES